ncbi:MAG: 3-phosphoserine/phosphohydroxythreonine transaminase [Capsulimonadales bacterium]|nr:3-phosphoserine/phosphohydroxythreonine transaminase [Capsulimonadales bacterium]
MRRIYNFSAGPAILPVPVLEEASRGLLEINGSGMSVLEVSHRSKVYDAVHAGAMESVLQTLNLSADEYVVMLLGGGASLQFTMLPMNFLGTDEVADYVDGGEWGGKAIKDAKRFGKVHVAGSSATTKYDRLPVDLNFSAPGTARYAHITTNNTIEGTQVFSLPDTNGAPLTADMSSDIFAVERDFSRFSLLYFGTQKNAGAAGVTVVVAKKAFLETAKKDLSPMLSYVVQAEKQSLYNTPPVFAVYLLGLVTQWVRAEGGIAALEKRNREKAQLIYDALDAYPAVYVPAVAVREDRSLMNITFRLVDETRNAEFLAAAKERDMDGLPGHRNVGGFRASIYNAFPVEGCAALAELLHAFARR